MQAEANTSTHTAHHEPTTSREENLAIHEEMFSMEGLLYVWTYPFHTKATFKRRTGSKNKTRLPKLFKPT